MSLQNFFNPKSVAVVGASQDQHKIGRQVLDNLLAGGFSGPIYPINLKEKTIAGKKAFPSLADLPRREFPALLVVLAIPAAFVVTEIKKCASLGIKNIIIITAGFKEANEDGAKLEAEITQLALRHKLNILGPNCLGLINTWHKLNATFATAGKNSGNVALLSQSGAVGSAALDWLKLKDFNFGYFISLGNKAVIDENQVISYLAADKRIDLVVAYLEAIHDGKKMMNLISRLAKHKPVAILKAGTSLAGSQLALSHTGSLAGSSAAVEAGLRRAGAIWLENLEELFNLLLIFRKESWHNQGAPELYVMTNAGGLGVLTVDEISRHHIPFGRSLDLLGDADAARYEAALKTMLSDKQINNLLVLLTPQTSTEPEKTAAAIIKAAKKYPDKLILTSFVGGDAIAQARDMLEKSNIASFDYPEEAVRSFRKLIDYKETIKKVKTYSLIPSKIKEPLKNNDYLKSLALLEKYGIKVVKTKKFMPGSSQALKYPAVLKIVGPDFLHKTDKGAVVVGLESGVALNKAHQELAKQNKKYLLNKDNYFVVQAQETKFQELILGFKRDASFGPIIMAGLGGIYAEVFKEIKLETSDLDLARAMELIKGLKIYPILNGARGQRKYDIKGLARILIKLARLANEHPEISELDINPLFVKNKEVLAGDIRIIL